jgi:hypothetical protein
VFGDTRSRLEQKESEFDKQALQLKMALVRCQRAQKMAASLEKQLRNAAPDTKVDYSYVHEVEPSTQLLAALFPRVNEDAPDSSAVLENALSSLKKCKSQSRPARRFLI